MKKIIFLSMLVAGTFSIFSAQAQKGSYVSAQGAPQLNVMYNKSDFKNEDLDIRGIFGASFGIGGGYNFNKNMGVGADVMYSVQGQRFELKNDEYTKRLQYLKIPVYFSYNTNPDAKVMFTVKGGPQLSILTSAKTLNKDRDVMESNAKDKYEKVTFGAMAGTGVRVNVAKNLYVEGGLRFDGDFTDAENKDHKTYKAGREKTYNMNAGVEFGVKYFFN